MTRIVETIGQAGEPTMKQCLEYAGWPTDGHDLDAIQKAYLAGREIWMVENLEQNGWEYTITEEHPETNKKDELMPRLGYLWDSDNEHWYHPEEGDSFVCDCINNDITYAYDWLTGYYDDALEAYYDE